MHTVKKSLTEYGDKLEAAEKTAIEDGIKELEEVLKDASASKDTIEAKTKSLETSAQKLGEKMYADMQAKAQAEGGGAGGPGAGPAGGGMGGMGGSGHAAGGAEPAKEKDMGNVMDAEFTEVKDKK